MAKVNVYIDGFNLYYGALRLTPFKWLDLSRVCQALLPTDTLHEINYFTARVSARPSKPNSARDQGLYIRALKTIPNLTVHYGHFLTNTVPMYLAAVSPPKRVWVEKTEEKGSDVNLASHLVRDAFQQRFEVAVLVTNDSDLAEPVPIVTQELKMPVGILNPHRHHSKELQRYATFVKRIRQGHLTASQFPDTLKDAKGDFSKPIDW
jgi:NYN domain